MANFNDLAGLEYPSEPSWWPMPTEFWLTIVFMLFMIMTLWLIKRYRSRYVRAALGELSYIQSSKNLYLLDTLLRRVALTHYPREQVASLHGEAWMSWLDSGIRQNHFAVLSERWFSGLYSQHDMDEETWQACIQAARTWILTAKPNKA